MLLKVATRDVLKQGSWMLKLSKGKIRFYLLWPVGWAVKWPLCCSQVLQILMVPN